MCETDQPTYDKYPFESTDLKAFPAQLHFDCITVEKEEHVLCCFIIINVMDIKLIS